MSNIFLERSNMKGKIEIVRGDICQTETEAIVAQANIELEGEDKTTARLLESGGEEVFMECNNLQNLNKGDAFLTTAGDLPAKFIIHAVIHSVGECAEEDEVMMSVRNALNLAKEKMLTKITMPMIGGGKAGIPIRRAAELMLAEVKKHLEGETSLGKVLFVSADQAIYEAFDESFRQL